MQFVLDPTSPSGVSLYRPSVITSTSSNGNGAGGSSSVSDATTSSKGIIQLAGDLNGTGSTAAAPKVKNIQRVFNILDYGAVGDGVTDDTDAINDAITAAMVEGGSVYVPPTDESYLCEGAIAIPYSGPYLKPIQKPLRIFGDGPNWNGYWTGTFVGTGSILDLRYDGTDGLHPGKIDTRGGGYLEIDHLSLVSGGTDDFRFIHDTNTTLNIHDVAVQGNPSKSAGNCVQDFLQLGGICVGIVNQTGNTITGTGTAFTADLVGSTMVYNNEAGSTKAIITAYVSPTELTTSVSQTIVNREYGFLPGSTALNPFQGYGTHLYNNYYSRIRRGTTFGNYTNDITIERETFSTSCGDASVSPYVSDLGDPCGAPYWFEPSFSSVGGNRIKECTIEAGAYAYGVSFMGTGYSYSNKIDHIGIYDDHGDTYGAVYCGDGAYYNVIIAGWLNSSLQDTYLNGPNRIYQTLISASQNAMSYSYVGLSSRNIVTKDITTVDLDNLPLGQSLELDTGTGGSNINMIANSVIFKDRNSVTLSQIKNSATAKGVYQLAQGATADRPSAVSAGVGSLWYDTTILAPIISDGTDWVVIPKNTENNINQPYIALKTTQTGTQEYRWVGGFQSATSISFVDVTNSNAQRMVLDASGRFGFGVLAPTSVIHLKAGTATANTAPLKFTSGTVLTTPEAGAIEFDGTHFYGTVGSTRYQLEHVSASATAAGTVELATDSETTTGTDATRAVTPDGLAGSTVFGRKSVCIQVTDGTTNAATGDGKAYFTIPESLNGMNLVRAQATVVTAGTTNATTVMIHNKTDAADMLSGAISIASGGTVGTVGTVNTSTDDVATNDVIRIDVDSVSTTPPQGLMVTLEFQLP